MINNFLACKQEIFYGKPKINEEAQLEFEKKKGEMLASFTEKKNAQDEYYVGRIADLEDKIAALKVDDVPMHELEIQRNNKK